MKKLEEYELKRLKEIIRLVKEELQRNNILYSRLLQDVCDEEIIYSMSIKYDNKIKNLEKSLLIPYFARIDFKADDEISSEKIYIGKTNVFDENSKIAVVDWRAPISSIYYDGKIGRTQYECPEGIIKGELSLKRQYIIENAKLIDYNDVDITTNDQLLQDCLNENSDVRLKNIVSTIQSEQNKIIRANMFKPLIVQGVAGSGKTTVALHRIAYLVYTYEKNFKPEEFLIIAPNKFFLDYISNVLPDLGVDYVRQQTFEEFSSEFIGGKLEIEDPNIELAKIVNEGRDKTRLIQDSARFKSSIKYKEVIDEYLTNLINKLLPQEDFKIVNYVIVEHQEIKRILQETLSRNCVKESIDIVSNILQKKVSNISNELIEKITSNRRMKINNIDRNLDEETQQRLRKKIFEETEYEVTQLLRGGKKLVTDYIKQIKLDKSIEYYKKIIASKQSFLKYIDEELYSFIVDNFNQKIKKKIIEYEDLTPLLYIQYKIFGLNERLTLKHIVIDEAQDFSEFQFFVLNEVLQNNKSITILGDIAQGIYSYRGTKDWNRINEIVFDNEASIERLDNSYRTTVEIMNEANKIIDKIKEKENIKLAIPISRHREKVNYIKTENFDGKIKIIENKIMELKNKGYRNIAIIAKNSKICNKIYKRIIEKNIKVELISEDLIKYDGGITIVPSYLSKGLEFDNVIVADFNSYDNSEVDIKLLYVALTRAMHTLDIIF